MQYHDLVRQLYDMEQLAVLPNPGERAGQQVASSRAAGGPAAGPVTLAEIAGPGVIRRIWAAHPGPGHVAIFLDDATEPVFDMPFSAYFRRFGAPSAYPELAYHEARGCSLYIPIPFRQYCRVVAQPGWGQFCHVTYTQYAVGTDVPVFLPGTPGAYRQALSEASASLNQALKGPAAFGQATTVGSDCREVAGMVVVPPGGEVNLADLGGPAAISGMMLELPEVGQDVSVALIRGGVGAHGIRRARRLPIGSPDQDVLRQLTLQIHWDGESRPAVWAPLGDFFASVPGWQPHSNLPSGWSQLGGFSRWYMPFAYQAKVTIGNDGTLPRPVKFSICYGPLRRPLAGLGRLHAKWHREDADGVPLLAAQGPGRYVGAVVHACNQNGGNWSCGGELIRVDGETAPSWQGTASEHYFGYAYSSPQLFSRAFHSQIAGTRIGGWNGHTTANRWHICDSIPFQEQITVELGEGSATPGMIYAATVFWYQANGGDRYRPVPVAERVGYWPRVGTPGDDSVLEGEDLSVMSCSGGHTITQVVVGHGQESWSGRQGKAHLLWSGARPGDRLELSLPVSRAGYYRLWAQLVTAVDHGIVQLSLDGRDLAVPIDLRNEGMSPTGAIELGCCHLEPGNHILALEMAGADGLAQGRPLGCGLDYVWLEELANARVQPKRSEETVRAGRFVRIYDPSLGGEPITRGINDHCFVQGDDGTWHMFGITEGLSFAHATTKVLTEPGWHKQVHAMTAQWYPWREVHLWAPHVIRHDGLFYMFYCAGSPDPTRYHMCLATSTDLWHWERSAGNPLFTDGFDARDPMVLRLPEQWVMYYTANTTPAGGNCIVAYRTSTDLLHWSERRVAFTDPVRGKAGGTCESPFVVRRGDLFYLLVGPRRGYVGTEVFRSHDPFHWEVAERAGFFRAHAAEAVRDNDGRWYVSGAGVGQGGLYLAPLDWGDGLVNADSSQPV